MSRIEGVLEAIETLEDGENSTYTIIANAYGVLRVTLARRR
jgi:hypothetical protein